MTVDPTPHYPAPVDPLVGEQDAAPPPVSPAAELVGEALATVLDADPAAVAPDARLGADLGADSLAVVELGIVIEQAALRRRWPLHLALGALLPYDAVADVVVAVERALAVGEGLPDPHPAESTVATTGGPPT
ncbi:MAG TPA: phosphopantetheine-binding protein [Frankiaceae bacterium]